MDIDSQWASKPTFKLHKRYWYTSLNGMTYLFYRSYRDSNETRHDRQQWQWDIIVASMPLEKHNTSCRGGQLITKLSPLILAFPYVKAATRVTLLLETHSMWMMRVGMYLNTNRQLTADERENSKRRLITAIRRYTESWKYITRWNESLRLIV